MAGSHPAPQTDLFFFCIYGIFSCTHEKSCHYGAVHRVQQMCFHAHPAATEGGEKNVSVKPSALPKNTHTLVREEKYSRACGYTTGSSSLTDVSGSLLTCRQNTFSSPRRGWMRAPEGNLGAGGGVSEVMSGFSRSYLLFKQHREMLQIHFTA